MKRKTRPRLPVALAAGLALLASACLMPSQGTPVFVDLRAGDFWSGKGRLLEVSDDRARCRVAVRDRAGFVRELWTDCTSVHERSGR